MVPVHVRDVDLVDLLRLIAGGLHVRDQIAERRSEQLAGTGVDHDQLCSGVDEERVDRRLDRILDERARERILDVSRRGIGEQRAHRQRDGAVRQDSDFEVADHHPIEAGRRTFLHWGGRVRGRDHEGRRQCCGKCASGDCAGAQRAKLGHAKPP